MRYTVLCLSLLAMLIPLAASAELKAGAAKADITPPVGGRMYGYGDRGSNVSQGVHDRLFAKAIVLDDGAVCIAIVSLDMGSFGRENTANVKAIVKEKAGIENILCVASHSHSTPAGSRRFPSEETPWIREAERKIAGAIIEAARGLAPVRLGVGWGEVHEGHNRRKVGPDGKAEMLWANRERVPTSPVDYQLGVIRVEKPDGTPMAALVNFTCHPVVLGPENLLISADYVGVLTREVEQAVGGQCMFLQGAAGDINPFWDKTPPDEGGFEQVEKMGKTVAAEATRVFGEITDFYTDPKLSFHTEIVPLASRRDVERKKRHIKAEVNTVAIGKDIALATFPGEFFVEHGLSLKRRSKFKHTFFVGYCNDALHYFPTINACTEGGYGADEATMVQVGAAEHLVNRALINLYYQAGMMVR